MIKEKRRQRMKSVINNSLVPLLSAVAGYVLTAILNSSLAALGIVAIVCWTFYCVDQRRCERDEKVAEWNFEMVKAQSKSPQATAESPIVGESGDKNAKADYQRFNHK